MRRHVGQRIEVSRVRELVEIDQTGPLLVEPLLHEIAADKTGPARD